MSVFLRRYVTGIIPRYVIGQVARAFLMALATMTAVFVLIMVMAEATRWNLGPRQVLAMIPMIMPVTLPYTVPVALLFAVSVVYGRMASDNEVVAVKAAGLGAGTVLTPSLLLGAACCLVMIWASRDAIPRLNHEAKVRMMDDYANIFFMFLKRDKEMKPLGWPYDISVRDIEGHTLKDAIFRHKADPKNPDAGYDAYISAKSATMIFDAASNPPMVRVELDDAEIVSDESTVIIRNGEGLDFPFTNQPREPMLQEMTRTQLVAKKRDKERLIRDERQRQAIAAGMWIASGRIGRIVWPEIETAFHKHDYWKVEVCGLETEMQMRDAMALGGFFFVLLGAPVGIRFAKRDFLSAFITCFVPIILAYYPLTMLGMNLGKDGNAGFLGAYIVYAGNVLLLLLAVAWALPPVLKH